MRGYAKVMRYLVWLTQLGLSVAVPLVGFILLGTWLHNSRDWGGWTVAVGVALGPFQKRGPPKFFKHHRCCIKGENPKICTQLYTLILWITC